MLFRSATKEFGKGVGRGLAAENIEEVSIYATTELVDSYVFDRKGDYSQIGKVMIDASIMSGSSNTLSLGYQTVANSSMKNNIRDQFQRNIAEINAKKDKRTNLQEQLSQLEAQPNTKENRAKKKKLQKEVEDASIEIQERRKSLVVDWQNYNIQLLGIDEKTHGRIYELNQSLISKYQEAGINESTLNNPEALNEALQKYADKLNSKKQGDGDTWLEGVNEINKTLTALKFSFEECEGGFNVKPPSYRFDISIEEDLVEEVIRIYGFDKIEAIPPLTDS